MDETVGKKKKTPNTTNSKTIALAILGIFLIIGVSYAVSSVSNYAELKDEGNLKLPSYAYTNSMSLKAYKYAATHPEVLEQIPCYCGCGGHGSEASKGKPHRFLRDCFINDDLKYDPHGSNCDMCLALAIKAKDSLASGMTLKEARAKIDAEYMNKYPGVPMTDTPPVKDNYKPILTSHLASKTPTT